MAEDRRVSATGIMEKIDTSKYLCETRIFCPDCAEANRGHLWVKSYVETSANLECPVCWANAIVPKGTESPIKR